MKRLLTLALLGALVLPLASWRVPAATAGEEKPAKALLDVKGQLGEDDPQDEKLKKPGKSHEFKMEGGKGYKIDLKSKDFDTFLRLLNPDGKEVAFNDDAEPPALDSRIIYVAPKEGMYKIVVTTFDGKVGNYSLVVIQPSKADMLQSRAQGIFNLKPAEQKQVIDELKKHFAEKGKEAGIKELQLAMSVAMTLESRQSPLAAEVYRDFGKMFADADNDQVVKASKQMAGAARRLSLPGKAIEVKGTKVDGKKLNWADYKGKVVLVDFWATWCGPCRAEIPNMKEMYEKYHEKGFEIVGISLDRDADTPAKYMEENKLPWTCTFDKDQPMTEHYGVFSIPQAILVGRDGNVVSLNARGAELGKLLEKLLSSNERERN